jgi:hypothetical protein
MLSFPPRNPPPPLSLFIPHRSSLYYSLSVGYVRAATAPAAAVVSALLAVAAPAMSPDGTLTWCMSQSSSSFPLRYQDEISPFALLSVSSCYIARSFFFFFRYFFFFLLPRVWLLSFIFFLALFFFFCLSFMLCCCWTRRELFGRWGSLLSLSRFSGTPWHAVLGCWLLLWL